MTCFAVNVLAISYQTLPNLKLHRDMQAYKDEDRTLGRCARWRLLACLSRGLANKQIADALSLSEKTVKNHVTSIFRTLGVINRTQAVLAAKQLGMFSR